MVGKETALWVCVVLNIFFLGGGGEVWGQGAVKQKYKRGLWSTQVQSFRYYSYLLISREFGVAKWDLLVPTDSEGHRGYWYSSSMHLVSISRSYVSK